MVLSSNQTNFTTPQAQDQSFMQYLQNPMNKILVSPKYGWAQMHLGKYVPDYSDLSTGNTPVFGGGFDLRPGNFQIAAFYGNSQRAVNADTNAGIPGAYATNFFSTRLAYLGDKGSSIGLNFVQVSDDTNSVKNEPLTDLPSRGMLTTMDFTIAFTNFLHLYGEGGICYYTRNVYSDEIEEDEVDFIPDLLKPKYSSRYDFAAKGGFLIKQKKWEIDISSLFIGDGYEPLGYRFMQTDRIEYTIAPKIRLFDNKLMLNGSLGQRFNNFQDTKAESSIQLIGSVGAYAQITDKFSLSADFSNYGVRNNIDNDTLKVEIISKAFSITPAYSFRSSNASHRINATYSQDDFSDLNTLTRQFQDNTTLSFMLAYSIRFENFPLSLNTSANHVQNNVKNAELELNALNIGGSYPLLDNKLTPDIRFTFSQNSVGDNSSDIRFGLRGGLRYKIIKGLSLRFSANLNSYDYGSSRNNMAYTETFIRTKLSYRFL